MLRGLEYLLEITAYLLRLHIKRAKAFDARRIDEIASGRELYHLAEGSRVHAGIVRIGDFCRAQVHTRHQCIDKRRLAHPTVAAQHRHPVRQQRTQPVYAIALHRRHLATDIAHSLVERDHHLLVMTLLGSKQIGLVEDQHHRHAVGFGRGQESVYERGRSLRMADRDHEKGLVHIGGDDVALLGEILRLAHDIVAPVLYLRDKGCTLGVAHYLHTVTHSHGIGAADAA